jgi:hypothetical protein
MLSSCSMGVWTRQAWRWWRSWAAGSVHPTSDLAVWQTIVDAQAEAVSTLKAGGAASKPQLDAAIDEGVQGGGRGHCVQAAAVHRRRARRRREGGDVAGRGEHVERKTFVHVQAEVVRTLKADGAASKP